MQPESFHISLVQCSSLNYAGKYHICANTATTCNERTQCVARWSRLWDPGVGMLCSWCRCRCRWGGVHGLPPLSAHLCLQRVDVGLGLRFGLSCFMLAQSQLGSELLSPRVEPCMVRTGLQGTNKRSCTARFQSRARAIIAPLLKFGMLEEIANPHVPKSRMSGVPRHPQDSNNGPGTKWWWGPATCRRGDSTLH